MKRLLWITLCLFCGLYAQTTITGPNVSGVWTTAGSPYIVQNEISITANDILTIQPGVVVKFEPATRLEVFGQLIASGSSTQLIRFESSDTTNWFNENTTDGGWNGIHIHPYGGSIPDQTILSYCVLQDVKYGFSNLQNFRNPLWIERGMKMQNCRITHNQTSTGIYGAGPAVYAQLYISTDTFKIDKCSFSDNTAHPSIITVQGSVGYFRITNTHIYQNFRGSGITGNGCRVLVENNEIDNNYAVYDSAPLYLTTIDAIVRGNNIHHNVSPDHGGITCNYGNTLVENNFIHNNYQSDAACGLTEGGGGINITCFGSDINNGFFIVRNNIIANNYSALGGGGINVYEAITAITNNHIINNHSTGFGKSVFINHPSSKVYMRSNLLYNQTSPGMPDTTGLVHIYNGSSLWFDYNFIPSGYSRSVVTGFSYMLYGDTTHNIISTNPGLINPTPDNDYLTDAGQADFSLSGSSICINRGDTVGAFPAMFDYTGNNRFVGIIDIGAFEYQNIQEPVGIDEAPAAQLNIYPNPAEMSGGFNVVLPENKGKIVIYDLTGKQVFYQPVTQQIQRIDFNPESKGIYLVHFYGKTTYTQKLIIH